MQVVFASTRICKTNNYLLTLNIKLISGMEKIIKILCAIIILLVFAVGCTEQDRIVKSSQIGKCLYGDDCKFPNETLLAKTFGGHRIKHLIHMLGFIAFKAGVFQMVALAIFAISVLNFKMLAILIVFHVSYFLSKLFTKLKSADAASKSEPELDDIQSLKSPLLYQKYSPYHHLGPLYSPYHRHKSDQNVLQSQQQNLFEPADERHYSSH